VERYAEYVGTTLLVLKGDEIRVPFDVHLGIDNKNLKTLDFEGCTELRFVAVEDGFRILFSPVKEVLRALPQDSITNMLERLERAKTAVQEAQNLLRGDLETIVRETHNETNNETHNETSQR
jgi:hypothetical protein